MPILVLLLAMLVVIGSVIVFRLHAFLALLLGCIVVSALTPADQVLHTELRSSGLLVQEVTADRVLLADDDLANQTDSDLHVFRFSGEKLEHLGLVRLSPIGDDRFRSAAGLRLQSGDLLMADPSGAVNVSRKNFAKRIANGFGGTCGKIGILIALASIVGTCLLRSGAADQIVSSIRKFLGEDRTPVAFTISGFIVGIPVFFDTVFYLLLPLAKAMARKSGRNYLLYVLSVVIGATMAHSLVPPTPGPLFVANELNVDLGKMMLGGTFVGLIAAAAGFAYALLANRLWVVDVPDESAAALAPEDSGLRPPLSLSLLPILLPVVLLGTRTIFDGLQSIGSVPPSINRAAMLLSAVDSTIAIGLSAVIGLLLLLAYSPPGQRRGELIEHSLRDAGSIILITAIGGAFGHVLRQSGIAYAIQQAFPAVQSGIALLCAAFAITAIVRVAQGSATVAMITSIGIIGPLAASIELPFDSVYLALAIGCGSKPLPWMNDSGFWVVGRMSGMTERQTLSTFSVSLTIMGITGFLVVLLAAIFFPLA